jgi:hypothetical protein
MIFPFFLTFLFPKMIKWNVIFTGAFFVFWKSPLSQSFIDFYNSISFIEITRVVDYSDYIALSMLPISYYSLKKVLILNKLHFDKISISPIIILLPSIVIFMATSPPYWHRFTYTDGNLRFFRNKVNLKMSQQEVLKKLEQNNIKAYIDTSFKNNPYRDNHLKEIGFYKIDEIIIDKDTVRDLKFSIISFKENKTEVYLNSINISEDIKEEDVKDELRKYYKKLLRKYIIERVKSGQTHTLIESHEFTNFSIFFGKTKRIITNS